MRAQALLLLDALVLLATAPAFATRLALGMGVVEGLLWASVLMIALAVPALIRRGMSVRALGAILLGVCLSLNLIVTLAGDGIFSTTVVWFVLLPPVSAFLCGESSAVPAAMVSASLTAAISVLHAVGVLRSTSAAELGHRAVNLIALSACAAGIVRLYALSEDRARVAERRALRLLEAVSAHVEVGTLLVSEGLVLHANTAAEQILGTPGVALHGREAFDALPPRVSAHLRRHDGAEEVDLGGGQDMRRIEMRVSAIDHEGGDAALLTLVDITSRWRGEQDRLQLQARLKEAERVDSLGRIATGVAHDFNNLLVGILGNAEILAEGVAFTTEERTAVADIRAAGERAASLVTQLLDYAGRGHAVLGPVDAAAALREAVRLAEASRRRAGVIALDAPASLLAWADATLLSQVCTNLLTNALDALTDGGSRPGAVRARLTVSDVDAVELARDRLSSRSPQPGRYVRLEVIDQGVGISEEHQRRLFDPFFSTKPNGRGLGLAAVQGILQRLGAALLLRSEPGRGSSFVVLIPAASAEAVAQAEPPTPRASEPSPDEVMRVLAVDDDPLVRAQIVRVLRRSGLRVTEAESGAEALSIVADAPGAFGCVVVDYLMPSLDGVETARRLRQIAPSLGIVLCSGTVSGAQMHATVFDSVVSKPFVPAQLVRSVVSAAHRERPVRGCEDAAAR